MAGIAIAMNGTRTAAIGLDGMQVVSVFVHGALHREPKAVLEAHGGNYRAGACGHLIWIAEHPILPGDMLTIAFEAHCDSVDHGLTIDELYPDAAPSTKADFSITDEVAADIRARPRLHDAFLVHVETSSGEQASAASDDRNDDMMFSLVWDDTHPDQLRVHFRTCCFDDVAAKRGGTTHLQTMLAVGESVSMTLVR